MELLNIKSRKSGSPHRYSSLDINHYVRIILHIFYITFQDLNAFGERKNNEKFQKQIQFCVLLACGYTTPWNPFKIPSSFTKHIQVLLHTDSYVSSDVEITGLTCQIWHSMVQHKFSLLDSHFSLLALGVHSSPLFVYIHHGVHIVWLLVLCISLSLLFTPKYLPSQKPDTCISCDT